jgi:diacylglycerol kinase (ATP)
MVERAKNIAAGAVLISAVGAAVIGLLVFGPKLLALRS